METTEYNLIKREILDLIGVDLNGYKTPQMQRRLKSYLLRSGQETWSDLFNLMRQSPTELQKLKDFRDSIKLAHTAQTQCQQL